MSLIDELLGQPYRQIKPRVFVSYHHGNDQAWYNRFATVFGGAYDVFTDRSLRDSIHSENAEYVMRVIREQYITGSSVTVVLCGGETWKRKYVDWEIKATLDKGHGLLGVLLPTVAADAMGNAVLPDRLADNIRSGYAHWVHWTESAPELSNAVADARQRSSNTTVMENWRQMMGRNRS